MASLKKRKGVYYIRFSKVFDEKRREVTLSLKTTSKKQAQQLLADYENRYAIGEIDPFNGWTPEMEVEQKRKENYGKYMTLEKATELFLAERHQANETSKKNYRRHFNMLKDLVGQTMPISQIAPTDIREFCFKPGIKPATQASYLRHLKVFFNWLYDNEMIKSDPTSKVTPPKPAQNLAEKVITEKQLHKIFEEFDKYTDQMKKKRHITKPEQKRFWFKPMIATIYYCGLRAKEAVNLTWQDINLKDGYITIKSSGGVQTKTGEDRTIPIRSKLYPYLEEWFEFKGKPKEGYVFPSATGFSEWHKMDTGALSKSFKKFVREANLPESINLHGLRHSSVTDLLRKGVPITQVSKYHGHSSVQVTQIYEHLNKNDLKETLDKYDV